MLPEEENFNQKDVDDAKAVAEKFQLQTQIFDMSAVLGCLYNAIPVFDPKDKLCKGNLKARTRMIYLYYYANKFNRIVCGSSDKSETMMGYFTKWGERRGARPGVGVAVRSRRLLHPSRDPEPAGRSRLELTTAAGLRVRLRAYDVEGLRASLDEACGAVAETLDELATALRQRARSAWRAHARARVDSCGSSSTSAIDAARELRHVDHFVTHAEPALQERGSTMEPAIPMETAPMAR